jgi:hypothetical protein
VKNPIFFIYMGGSYCIKEATSVLKPEWFLFIPSHYGFAIYDSYINKVENNKLFEKDLRNHLIENYQSRSFQILKDKKWSDKYAAIFNIWNYWIFRNGDFNVRKESDSKRKYFLAVPLEMKSKVWRNGLE